MSKICPKCKKDKENKMFFHNSVKADGLSHWCKECSKKKKENCSICGKSRPVYSRVENQPYCSKCYRGMFQIKTNCVVCHKPCFPVLKEGVCQHCYDLRPRTGHCSVCRKVRQIKVNNEYEKVCTMCYESERRPKKKCVLCGKTKKVGKMLNNGPMCISCYDAQPERVAARFGANCRRRANDSFELPPNEWCKLMNEYHWECFYCGDHLSEKNRTVDHVIPIIKGGNSEYKNLIPSCGICNRKKGTKDFIRWANEIELSCDKIQHILGRYQKT